MAFPILETERLRLVEIEQSLIVKKYLKSFHWMR